MAYHTQIACWVLIGLVIAWMVTTLLIALLICQPVAKNWDFSITTGHCGDTTVAFIAVAVIDIVIDLLIFALPVPMVLNLQVSTAHRIALAAIFGVGILYVGVPIHFHSDWIPPFRYGYLLA